MAQRLGLPDLGVGVGLRVPHYRTILDTHPEVDFFEVISENFMVPGGKPRYHLDQVRERYRLVQHGVSLGIGSPEAPAEDYVERLCELTRHVAPPWVSDHFCWCMADGLHLHDLLPLPYTDSAITRVVDRARRLQDRLGVRFALENTSSYMTYRQSTMSEWEFVSRVAEAADIGLLFDVNNVYVSAYNHGFDPFEFVRQMPHERIVQIHLAGHTNLGSLILDTHSGPPIDPVLELYRYTIELAGPVSTLIEWDEEIPPFQRLMAEVARVRAVRERALGARARRIERGEDPAAAPRPPACQLTRTPADANAHHAHGGWQQGGPREAAATVEVGS